MPEGEKRKKGGTFLLAPRGGKKGKGSGASGAVLWVSEKKKR